MKGMNPRDAQMVEQLAEWRQGVRTLGGDHHAPSLPKTESQSDSVFYFKDLAPASFEDEVIFDELSAGSVGHIVKTLKELGYHMEAVELFEDCVDAYSLGLGITNVLDIALDRFYVLDEGAYEKYADLVVRPMNNPTRETQIIEFPHGWLERVAA